MFHWIKNAARTSSKRQRASARLAVEGLERRDCPTTAVGLVGHTLNIIGDDSADNVTVTIRDSVNDIQVTSNNGQVDHFSSLFVKKINIDLKGGDDLVRVQLGLPDAPGVGLHGDASMAMFDRKDIVVNLGDGNDEAGLWFGGSVAGYANRVIATNLNITVNAGEGVDDVTANFGEMQSGKLQYTANLGNGDDTGFAGVWGGVDTGATVKLKLKGQGGNDTLNTFETFSTTYDSINVAAGALLDINVNGGVGTDSMNMTYGGTVLGKLRIRQIGGDDNDTVKGDLHLNEGSTGALDAVFLGGNGRDRLRMELYGAARVQRALVDGGSGLDWASSVGDVQIINANELRPPIFTPPVIVLAL